MSLKIVLSFLFFYSFFSCWTFGQSIENQLFEQFCKKINEQNDNYLFKDQIPGSGIAEDPATGEIEVFYGSNSKALEDFKKFEKAKQIEILRSVAIPVFPLKDTIYVLDTSAFFSKNLNYTLKNKFFKVITEDLNTNNSKIQLAATGIRKNYFILAFSYPDWNHLINYYFVINENKFKLDNSTKGPNVVPLH